MALIRQSARAENIPLHRRVSNRGLILFSRDIINTTVAKGEVVIETAQPLEIARATRVGSAGRIGSAPRMLPKKTAIIIGLTPRYDTGIIAIDNKLKNR
jgi:hypothetical protein